MISKNNRLVGAILLVSGTTIGAGMLALPITTGLAGFIPALLVMTAIWLFMMLTAFYLLEVNLRMKGESNFISMAHITLGKPGEVFAWVTYLLLLYTLTSAYMVGSSQILHDFLGQLIPFAVPSWCWPVAVFLVFGTVVYFGTESVDFLNRVLMVALVLLYLSVVGFGILHIDPPKLAYFDWDYLLPSISVVITTFGYHIIIPTLSTYLEHDTKCLKQAIVIGSLIPFLIYIFWQLLVMGVMPVTGDLSLSEAAAQGHQVTVFLVQILNSPWIKIAVRAFAFCAIVTSLLGVSLSLADFLSDGLKIKKTRFFGKLCLILLTFAPPLLFTLIYPKGFLIAIDYAGIFVVALLVFLPTLMAWFERYGPETERSLIKSEYMVRGGKFGVIATLVLSLILLGIEVFL